MASGEEHSKRALTRRGVFAVGAGAAAGTVIAGPALPVPTDGIVPSRAIHLEEDFDASPARIYTALLDAGQFSRLTGQTAVIDPAIGGAFSLFNGVIFGRTLAKKPDRLLVQAWSDTGWAEGFYSIVRFALTPRGNGARLVFDHTAIPLTPGEDASLVDGWKGHYWAALHKIPA